MARYTGPVCRLCRRERMKLFLKGDRCFKEKCAVERRNFPPGQHGTRRGRRTLGYGLQLREKQKVKRIYGVLEVAVPHLFRGGRPPQGDHRREPAGACSSGAWTTSSTAWASPLRARRRASSSATATCRWTTARSPSPPIQVKAGQAVAVKEASRKNPLIRSSVETARGRGVPEWLELNAENTSGRVLRLPLREDIKLPIQEQLIVELYSR